MAPSNRTYTAIEIDGSAVMKTKKRRSENKTGVKMGGSAKKAAAAKKIDGAFAVNRKSRWNQFRAKVNKLKMKIDEKKKQQPEPERMTRQEVEWQEYKVRLGAAEAADKLQDAIDDHDRQRWANMSRRSQRQEQLFLSFDIDLTRIKLSDPDLVSA